MRRSLVLTDKNAEREKELVRAVRASGWQVADIMRLNDDALRDPNAVATVLSQRARRAEAQDIVISISDTRMTTLRRVLLALPFPSTRIHLARRTSEKSGYEAPEANDNVQYFFSTLPPRASSPWQGAIKRAFDIALAGSALVLLMPFLLLVALLVRLDSPGPILFRQTRTGRHGRPFQILKFRSMSVVEDGPSVRQATPGDSRVTRIGRLLRKSSIDELPQLLNVLAGDMSIVGPRPHALAHDRFYGAQIADYIIRQQVRPGLTGWAQIHGSRGPTPRLEDMENRIRLDLWYVRHWSLLLDLRIILRTIPALLRKGAAF